MSIVPALLIERLTADEIKEVVLRGLAIIPPDEAKELIKDWIEQNDLVEEFMDAWL